MKGLCLFLFVGVFFLSTSNAKNSADAVKKTQESLKDKKSREELLKEPSARKANDAALGVAGSEQNLDEMYKIASELLPVLMEMNENDPEKAAKSLEAFQKDPEKFLNSLPESSKNRIKLLAEKIQAESKKKP